MKFSDLNLSSKVLAAVEAAGYEAPTPIQAAAIPPAVEGRDVLGIAQTGTGKTASFVLPMLTRLERGRARARMPRSLILAPTRELAAQVAEHFERYSSGHKITLALLIGGVSFDEQLRKLDRGVDVLIATPGRLLDHFGRGKLLLNGVEILVIDEADRMLDMGFIPDIERICKLLPPRRQTLFFSATMPPEIQRLVKSFLRDPVRVEVAPPSTTAGTITQRFCFCPAEPREKRKTLRAMIRAEKEIKNAIIFCNRKRDVAILLRSMQKHAFNVAALHGDMDQRARMTTLEAFRAGEVTFLCASDVAARGLDIPDVSHVFNFDVPVHAEDYVHRIGRTGRAGRAGFALTLVTPEDGKVFNEIAAMLKGDIAWVGEAPDAEAFEPSRRGRGRGRGRGHAGPRAPSGATGKAGTRKQGEKAEKGEKSAKSKGARGDQGERRANAPSASTSQSAKKPTGSRRGRRKGRSAADTAAESSEPPTQASAAGKPHPEKRGRRHPDAAARSGQAPSRRPPRRKGNTAQEEKEEAVVGLGDHVPAFLKPHRGGAG